VGSGIHVEVLGDSSLFTRLGKGVSYLVRADGSTYLIDCGATPFLALGHEGVKALKGLVATHSHEDHRRWFTDLALYIHYHPDLGKRLRLITSEPIHEEYEKNSKGALERSLSADSHSVVEVPYSEFVEKAVMGPRAKYRIEALGSQSSKALRSRIAEQSETGGSSSDAVLKGRVWRVVETRTGEVVDPSTAKVLVNPAANRPRMLFKDPGEGLWVEPASYYPFTSRTFYESERNDLLDEETGLRLRAVKAPTWHGPPTIGVLIERGDDRVAFSSDTVFDPALWRELAEDERSLPPEAGSPEFAEAHVIEGDINDYIQRTWSRERYEEAMSAYDGAVVIHDADFEQSVVHTAQSNLTPDADWTRLVLTHTPDGFASRYPLTSTGKRYLVAGGDIFEEVGGQAFDLDADLYFKREDGALLVGYRTDSGEGRLWETPRGMAVEVGHDDPPPRAPNGPGKAEFLGRYELFFDMGGCYLPAKPVFDGRGDYRERSDGKTELVTETRQGSKGKVVEGIRRRERGDKAG